ncbi:MAG: acetoin utilization protein AcuC, partial [Chloroflexota bacterium]|nr:acetoin utilization protein AcuC [Chloroflexota bacterium]
VVTSLVPELAAAFGPDLIVSQHGADSHAWDPLAHLRNTTTSMGAAARLVDQIAHRFADGRWLSTGGGGYGVYNVVPRSWAHVWLAGAHRDVPDRLPGEWRDRWAAEAARYGTTSLPATFTDPPNAGDPPSRTQEAAERQSLVTATLVRETVVPRLIRTAMDRAWWQPLAGPGSSTSVPATPQNSPAATTPPTIVASIDSASWAGLAVAPRVIPPSDPADVHSIVRSALADGARVTAAVTGQVVVGLAVSIDGEQGGSEFLALGVAPGWRRMGLGRRLLSSHVEAFPDGLQLTARVTVAERDVVEPLAHATRIAIARRLLTGAGFELARVADPVGRADPLAIVAVRR